MKQFRTRLGAVALALLVVIATFAFALPVSAQADSATEIDSCTTITEPGTYVLTQDITDSDEDVCLRVVGDVEGVTIDGNGHTIDGVDNIGGGLDNYGVLVDGEDDNQEGSANPRDVTIRDLTVTDWELGISFRYATGTVTDVQATSNGYGLRLYESFADVSDSVFSDNERDGIWVDQASAEITDVAVNDNGNAGISGFDALIDVRDSTATGNRVGIEDEESRISVTDSTIADNEVRNEYSTDTDDGDSNDGNAGDGDGSDSDTGDATEIDSCTTITEPGTYVLTADIIDSDAETCIRIEAETDGVTIDGDGHTIDGVDDEDTDGIFAGENPFDAEATRDVTVENVVLTDWGNAIVYENVENSTIRDNTIESNGRGIDLFFGTADVEIRDNVLTDNEVGIDALGGTVTIANNVASNEVDYRSFATEDEGVVNHTIENFTLDTATVSLDNRLDQIDFFGGGARFELSAVESLPDDPDGLANVGQYVEGDSNSNAAGSFTLSVQYDDGDLDGVDEDSLALYAFADGEWTEVDGSSVDTDANTVSAEFDDPTLFVDGTVLAPLGSADGDDGTGDDDKDGDDNVDDDKDSDAGDNGSGDGDDGMADGDKNGDSDDGDDIVDVGAKDIVIDLGEIVIADFDLRGPGLQDEHIDERTYSIGGFDIAIDGLSFSLGDTDYRFCKVTIDVEPFDVILENLTLGSDR